MSAFDPERTSDQQFMLRQRRGFQPLQNPNLRLYDALALSLGGEYEAAGISWSIGWSGNWGRRIIMEMTADRRVRWQTDRLFFTGMALASLLTSRWVLRRPILLAVPLCRHYRPVITCTGRCSHRGLSYSSCRPHWWPDAAPTSIAA